MYQPPHFREDDPAALFELIRAHPLGLLVSSGVEGPVANLLPFQAIPGRAERGVLRAHMARANTQWQEIKAGAPVLVVFQGTNAYVTPSWYEAKQQTGKVVPTWNYAMVQVRGTATIFEDAEWLRGQVGELTATHEAVRAQPWAVDDAPEDFVRAQLKGIVGMEIEITSIIGKWKVSQNRPAGDIAKVADGFASASEPHANAEMANLVRRYGEKS